VILLTTPVLILRFFILGSEISLEISYYSDFPNTKFLREFIHIAAEYYNIPGKWNPCDKQPKPKEVISLPIENIERKYERHSLYVK
jgi:hypothetical protein